MVGWPGFSLVSVERGGCVMRCEVNEGAGAGAGSSGGMHGGVLASLLDCAGTLAAISSMQAGQEARGTMNLEISYLRPGAGAYVEATAVVKKPGATVTNVSVDIENDEGKLVCSGRILYAIGSATPKL